MTWLGWRSIACGSRSEGGSVEGGSSMKTRGNCLRSCCLSFSECSELSDEMILLRRGAQRYNVVSGLWLRARRNCVASSIVSLSRNALTKLGISVLLMEKHVLNVVVLLGDEFGVSDRGGFFVSTGKSLNVTLRVSGFLG